RQRPMTELVPFVVGAIIYLVFSAMMGCYVAFEKGRSQAEGFFFGLFFGPVGLLVVACLPTGEHPGRPVNRMAGSDDYHADPEPPRPGAVWLPSRSRKKGGE